MIDAERTRTPAQAARAKKAAQRSLLRTYLKHNVVIEVELGGTKFYPAFQFRDGKIIDALAEINQALAPRAAELGHRGGVRRGDRRGGRHTQLRRAARP